VANYYVLFLYDMAHMVANYILFFNIIGHGDNYIYVYLITLRFAW
jgi:hypothetical protein